MTITATNFPSVVAAYDPMTLYWSIKRAGSTQYVSIGVTQHDAYITYDTPTGSEPTRTRMGYVCETCAGFADEDVMAVEIWDDLSKYEPPVFDLQQGSCPVPCPWSLMVPGNPGQCIHLAILMEHACEILGVPASIGYVYATTDYVNFSTTPHAEQHRLYEYAPGQTRDEYLRYFASEGFNNWEAVCVVNGHYYAVKEGNSTDSVALIKDIICPNDPPDENYQCWRFYVAAPPPQQPYWTCNADDQYPAPLPGGCP